MSIEWSLARLVVVGVANLGVAKVVSDVVTSTAIPDTAFAGFKSKIGMIVIGSIIGDVVTNHVNGRIDQMVAAYSKQKAEIDAKVDEKVQEVVAKKVEETE